MNDSPQIIIYYKHYQKLPIEEEKKNINVTEHKKMHKLYILYI